MNTTPIIAGNEFGGLVRLIIGLLVLVLAIMWLIFPVLVLSKFNELLKVQREIRAALLSANATQSEIAKALQWMVNNWKQGSSKPPDQPPVLRERTSYSVYDDAGNVIETHEHTGDFKEP
jgi:hypothetical protein